MFSTYDDMPQLSMANLTPHVGTGIGLIREMGVRVSNDDNHQFLNFGISHKNHLAIQFATGLNYELSSNIAIGVEYRFINTLTRFFNTYYNLDNASLTYQFSV